MKTFNYSFPVKVYFGKGCAEQSISAELSKVGKTVMFAYGGGSIKRSGLYQKIMSLLDAAGKTVVEFSGIMSNPTYAKVQEGAKLAKDNNVDFILAVGGGSVIDCCKIVAAQAKYDEDIWEMEYSKGKIPTEYLLMGAIVTASGTGAEQNCGAVITNEEKKIKTGVFGAYANFVVLDSELTMSVPFKQVISGAFDTLSHCMETYFGKPQASNVSDEINEAVMRNTIHNIRALIKNPQDEFARGELMWDSAMGENGILKLGKTTDFQAHQIEHQLGAYTDCNHGQGLAVIHPALYRHIYKDGISKFARFAQTVWGISPNDRNEDELALAGINALADFIKEIGLPVTFSQMGITDESILKSVAETSNTTAGCCKKLSHEEIFELLKECM